MLAIGNPLHNSPLLNEENARLLCIALIDEFQSEQIRFGRMSNSAYIRTVFDGLDRNEIGSVEINEDCLGIDSLSLLDLVMKMAQYFGLCKTGVEDYLLVQRKLVDWSRLIAHHFELVGLNAEIAFATSGSTGTPKKIVQKRANLDAEIDSISSDLLRGTNLKTRILSMVAPHHIYGFLWSILLPEKLGVDHLSLYTSSFTRLIRESRCGDIVLATPYLWEKFATHDLKFCEGVTGVSSGGPTQEATWQAAQSLGLQEFVEVYGSTECGGVGYRRSHNTPFSLMTHLSCNQDTVQRKHDGSYLQLPDKVEWEGNSCFKVAGRLDNIVQVAGTNVNLDQVREVILKSVYVSDAVVRLDGDRLKTFVVTLDNDETAAETSLRKELLCLPSVARPDRFTFGSSLPRNDAGKLCNW